MTLRLVIDNSDKTQDATAMLVAGKLCDSIAQVTGRTSIRSMKRNVMLALIRSYRKHGWCPNHGIAKAAAVDAMRPYFFSEAKEIIDGVCGLLRSVDLQNVFLEAGTLRDLWFVNFMLDAADAKPYRIARRPTDEGPESAA